MLDVRDREVRVEERPRPQARPGEALVRTLRTGLDGTDEEVVAGEHGEPPEGARTLVLGHEALGEVVEAPPGSALSPGDLVVPLVRHGCGACEACARRAPDYCPGGYVEHGIRGLDGFLREYWTDAPEHLVRVPEGLGGLAVLAEPLSVAVKALEVAEHAARRVPWFDGYEGRRALVAGTGSLGALACLLLRNVGADVVAMDRSPDEARPAHLLASFGVGHVDARERDARDEGEFDLVVEATGSPRVLFDLVGALAPNGTLVTLGVPAESPPVEIEADEVMRRLVSGNRAVIGSVNSGRPHVERALRELASMRARWGGRVDGVVTHRFAPEEAPAALAADDPDVVKKVVDWAGEAS